MKKLSLLLFVTMISNANAQEISFNKLYSHNDPVNYFLGHYDVPGSSGLQIKWDGGIRLLTNNNPASVFQMLGNGDVGIGTDFPNAKLDVKFSGEPKTIKLIQFENTISAMNAALRFSWYDAHSDIGIIRGGNTNIIGLGFRFGNDEKMRLTSIGRLGIGTMSPNSKLEVADNSGATLSITTNKINGSDAAPLRPAIEFLGYDNGQKARISALERTYNGHGSALSFFVNDGGSATSLMERMSINHEGNVGIGITNPQNKLDVNGTIHSKEVKVDLSGWADFVFEKDYHLPTLEEVEKHISEKGHLQNIPSEKEVLENGLSLGENQKLLLQKIEELTLYVIEQNKKINNLESKINSNENNK